ncbi:hypothetical protein TPA0598_07_06400 [Streptomyces lydicamycinicus]|uniref:Uncharacterized protein n=1 Tax=Streptomyces lydicamycinicus TaxID=1546107 RepID=A0A0P4RCU6_9ACTN|nr:hypothetical protein TPA0598_07_06400 [Streptomyces lydicamycinicus]
MAHTTVTTHRGVRYIQANTSRIVSAVRAFRQAAAKTGERERVPGRCRLRMPVPLRRRCRTLCREASERGAPRTPGTYAAALQQLVVRREMP